MGTACCKSAQSDPDPSRLRRRWDGDSWLEAATRRRGANGRFRRKKPTDPPAQLCLFEGEVKPA
jgi:hypothetical protein